MIKYIFLIFIFFQVLSCTKGEQTKDKPAATKNNLQQINQLKDDLSFKEKALAQLQSNKVKIDSLKAHKKLKLEVLVKVPHKKNLIRVENEEWPEEVEKTFNIWTDSEGQVMIVGEFPFSASGDWDIEYRHYFDENGKIFSFERNTNFFNSICTEDVAYESITDFYNTNFKRINRIYNLVDGTKKKLKKADCVMSYDFPYTVYNNINDYLKRINYRS